ncbi:hypothetical protein HDV03_004183 [Kappamyces sp. JEL0829]|nr:hypothetical protein HDV03_004183 [Kappamyces sp. JEL0829]
MKRLASTTASGTGSFLPSVSWLLGKHRISLVQAQSIPGSGPKNRLLKGDVLAWLNGTTKELDVETLLLNEACYSVDLDVKALKGFASLLGAGLTLDSAGDVIACAALQSLAKKDWALQDTSLGLDRSDAIQLGQLDEPPSQHIVNGEVGILSLTLTPASSAVSFDELLGTAPSSLHCPAPALPRADDLLDFLSPSHPAAEAVRLELTVDARAVSSQAAKSYLALVKELVEKNPRALLQ